MHEQNISQTMNTSTQHTPTLTCTCTSRHSDDWGANSGVMGGGSALNHSVMHLGRPWGFSSSAAMNLSARCVAMPVLWVMSSGRSVGWRATPEPLRWKWAKTRRLARR